MRSRLGRLAGRVVAATLARVLRRSSAGLAAEIDAHLAGVRRLALAPGRREALAGTRSLAVVADLHDAIHLLPALERVAAGGPLLVVGDVTGTGGPAEAGFTAGVADQGSPVVFVSGNHDSDTVVAELARRGVVVLAGDGVFEVGGLRIAGHPDVSERRAAESYADRYERAGPDVAARKAFALWVRPLLEHIDVLMVHDERLLGDVRTELSDRSGAHPLLVLVGHTHVARVERDGALTILNPGSVGAGGSTNIADRPQALGLARLAYDAAPFRPRAVELVVLDPGTGDATVRHVRLD